MSSGRIPKKSLKGRHIKHRCDALSGLRKLYAPFPGRCALGWYVKPFQAFQGYQVSLPKHVK